MLPFLYLGSKKAAKNRDLLRRIGVTRVLNVTPTRSTDPVAGVPNYFERDESMTYRRCSVFDSSSENLSGYFDGCTAFIEQGQFYGAVLVHCVQGVSRSSTMVLAYLMKASVGASTMRCCAAPNKCDSARLTVRSTRLSVPPHKDAQNGARRRAALPSIQAARRQP